MLSNGTLPHTPVLASQVRQYHHCSRYASTGTAPGARVLALLQVRQYWHCSEYASTGTAPGTPVLALLRVRHCQLCPRYASNGTLPGMSRSSLLQVRRYQHCSKYASTDTALGTLWVFSTCTDSYTALSCVLACGTPQDGLGDTIGCLGPRPLRRRLSPAPSWQTMG